jgi:hypothetical protein
VPHERLAGGPDHVLTRGVIGPLERLVEQRFGERDEVRVVGFAATEGGARAEALQVAPAALHDPLADASQQHPDLGSLCTAVDVDLVECEKFPMLAGGSVEQRAVCGRRRRYSSIA